MKAAGLPNDFSLSGWYGILPPPLESRILDCDTHADYLIIGAGFAGLSAARQILSHDSNANVTLLEAQRVAWGASGRNSGFVIDLPHDLQSHDYAADNSHARQEIQQNRAAIDFMFDTAEEFGLKEYVDRCGKYHGAANETGLSAMRSFSDALKQIDEPCSFLNANEMQQLTGSEFYVGGIHTLGCMLIQPAAYIRGLAYSLQKAYSGFRLFENTPVTEIKPGHVTTSNGKLSAGKIILTFNGHLASFGLFERQLMHVFTYASMTRQLNQVELDELGGKVSWGLIPAHAMGTTVRRLKEGRIVIRNTFTYNPSMETSDKQIKKIGEKHDQSFRRRFPGLSNVNMEYRWGGHLCLSRNSGSVFGEIEENIFAACCCNGLGTSKSSLAGMLIADLVTGQQNKFTKQLLDQPPLPKLVPEPFMTLGARGHLAWTQWRAGREQ